jgi:hypothetical protein
MDFITVNFNKSIDRSAFDCEVHPALNAYIAQHAGQDEKRNVSRTFMYIERGILLGYYALAMSDFFRRVYTVSKQSGVAFVVVDAKDQRAASYYQAKLGFVASTNNPRRLILSTATLIKGFRAVA